MPTLVLGSASPARLATLRSAGVEPRVVVSGVDESLVADDDPARLAAMLAELKADAVATMLDDDPACDTFVLGCDSVLEFAGQVLGKPADADDARQRWRTMRGKTGALHTGHCLRDMTTGRTITRSAATVVHFASVTDDEIEAYVATGEPMLVAGGFTLDGLGGPFVSGIEGDPHNVIGLSLPLLRTMFVELGVAWTDLWKR